MDRYYYHGVSDLMDEVSIDIMINIISSGGLKTRNSVRELGDDYNHVCLYKKNDEYDYEDNLKSARSGWIDHCFFFIISPDILTYKSSYGTDTNLVDEWRSIGDIPLDKIVGIAIPFDGIADFKEKFPNLYDSFDEKLSRLISIAEANGWIIENSDEEDLCDRLDMELNGMKKK